MAVSARLEALNRAIENNPTAAVNFVLRGEYWLQHQDRERAVADFEKGMMLAQQALHRSEWGHGLQAYLDRAEVGLRLAQAE